jgi:hypothetical protein
MPWQDGFFIGWDADADICLTDNNAETSIAPDFQHPGCWGVDGSVEE